MGTQLRQPPKTILAITAFIIPLLSLVAPGGLTVTALIAAAWALLSGRSAILGAIPVRLTVVLALLTVFGLASSLWSIVPGHSVTKAGQLLVLFGAGAVLVATARQITDDERATVGLWLAAGIAVAAAFILVERASGGPLNYLLTGEELYSERNFLRYKRGAVVVALLLWPAVYWVWLRLGALKAIALAGITVGLLLTLESGTVAIAFGLGMLAALAVVVAKRAAILLLAVGLVAVVAISPIVDYQAIDKISVSSLFERHPRSTILSSASHRMKIWSFVSGKIAEKPLAGWGLDSSRAVPGGHTMIPKHGDSLPLHPHNAVLQLWLELGIAGAAAAAAVLLVVFFGLSRATMGAAPSVAAGAMTATVVVALVGFGIWQSWWIAAIMLTAAMVISALPIGPARQTQ